MGMKLALVLGLVLASVSGFSAYDSIRPGQEWLMKDKNVEELAGIGITSVPELAEAINDDAKVKEVIKALSGVGPKTVAAWKAALAEGDVADAAPAEAAAEVVEASEQQYVVKAKPELDEDRKS